MKSLKDYLPESFLAELTTGPNDSGSPISGEEAGGNPNPADTKYGTRSLKVGDSVAVKNMKYEGKVGIIDDFVDNEIAVVNLDGVGRRKFHIADLEYNDYSTQKDNGYAQELKSFKKLAGY